MSRELYEAMARTAAKLAAINPNPCGGAGVFTEATFEVPEWVLSVEGEDIVRTYKDGRSEVVDQYNSVRRYTQSDLDAAVAAERARCVRICRREMYTHTDRNASRALSRCIDEMLDRVPGDPTNGKPPG